LKKSLFSLSDRDLWKSEMYMVTPLTARKQYCDIRILRKAYVIQSSCNLG